jgi:hypothetical protein
LIERRTFLDHHYPVFVADALRFLFNDHQRNSQCYGRYTYAGNPSVKSGFFTIDDYGIELVDQKQSGAAYDQHSTDCIVELRLREIDPVDFVERDRIEMYHNRCVGNVVDVGGSYSLVVLQLEDDLISGIKPENNILPLQHDELFLRETFLTRKYQYDENEYLFHAINLAMRSIRLKDKKIGRPEPAN